MKLKIFHKLIALNIFLIVVLTGVFLTFNYFSNQSLLSNAMNGVDREVSKIFSMELAKHYEQYESWDEFTARPKLWEDTVNGTFFRVFFSLMPKQNLPPVTEPDVQSELPEIEAQEIKANAQSPEQCAPSFGSYYQRLSLLDEKKSPIINAEMKKKDVFLYPVKVNGQVVAWLEVGKINVDVLPLASHFFNEQLKNSTWAISISALVAIFFSVLFSRHITSPIKELTRASNSITRRDFDYTVRVNTADELHTLGESFNQVGSELKRYESQQKQWIMDISHELRTPLTILMGEVNAICDNVSQFDQSALLSIQEEVQHIKRLVDDLHDLSAMDAQNFKLEKQKIDLNALVQFHAQRFSDFLEGKNIQLQTNLATESLLVWGDKDRLSQIIINVLENNCRYTSSPGKVRLSLFKKTGCVVLVTEDSGPGVDTKELKYLFDRLYRVEPSRNRRIGGVGLGLSICKKIIESHGGRISAFESTLGGLGIRIELGPAE